MQQLLKVVVFITKCIGTKGPQSNFACLQFPKSFPRIVYVAGGLVRH